MDFFFKKNVLNHSSLPEAFQLGVFLDVLFFLTLTSPISAITGTVISASYPTKPHNQFNSKQWRGNQESV